MEIKFNFNIKRKFVVNGKEYNSLEEMPAAIREAYEKAVSKGGGTHFEKAAGKIVFNGQEYKSPDSMPADKRQIYETILDEVQNEEGLPLEKPEFQADIGATGRKDQRMFMSGDASRPITPQWFSSRALVIFAAVIALLMLIYMAL